MDAAGPVVVLESGGRSLWLGGALRDDVLVPGRQEATLADPVLWKRLKVLVGRKHPIRVHLRSQRATFLLPHLGLVHVHPVSMVIEAAVQGSVVVEETLKVQRRVLGVAGVLLVDCDGSRRTDFSPPLFLLSPSPPLFFPLDRLNVRLLCTFRRLKSKFKTFVQS